MMLTYKMKHNRDFSVELGKARLIAQFALDHRTISSKDVRQFGLKSVISNQILRKYSRNRNARKVNRAKLTVPAQGIRFSHENRTIFVPSLKYETNYLFRNDFEKIDQIEIDKEFAYISVTVPENAMIEPNGYLGVDRNTTGHIAVMGNPMNGKVVKLGKQSNHVHKKYRDMRRNLQKRGKYRKVKRTKKRERNISRDINHKVSKKWCRKQERMEWASSSNTCRE